MSPYQRCMMRSVDRQIQTMKLVVMFVIATAYDVLSAGTDELFSSMAFADVEDISCMSSDGTPHMVPLLNTIAKRYFKRHTTVVLYDEYFFYHIRLKNMLEKILQNYAYPLRHGLVNTTMAKPKVPKGILEARENEQLVFVLFTKELEIGAEAIRDYTGEGTLAVLVSQIPIYHVKLFLETKIAADITNLLVLVDPMIKVDQFTQKISNVPKECDILMFSHDIVNDSLGVSKPVIVTAWRKDHFTRRGQDSGSGYTITKWEGIEVRLMTLMSEMMNFTVEYKEVDLNPEEDVAQLVVKELLARKADLAIGGVYITPERMRGLMFSIPHTQDCASFISLASTALPKQVAFKLYH